LWRLDATFGVPGAAAILVRILVAVRRRRGDDRRYLPDRPVRASIAIDEQPAEIVDGVVRVETHDGGVAADPRPGVEAVRPSGQVVIFKPFEQVLFDTGGRCDFLE